MSDDLSKPRANAALLPSYQGRTVCLLGTAKDVDSNGTSFTLTTSDGVDLKINLQEPLNEYVSGLTEVQGQQVDSKSIDCYSYISFPQEVTDIFDMALYNDAVELINRLPQYYMQGIQQS